MSVDFTEIETASRRAVDYAAGFKQPVIMLEALEDVRPTYQDANED